MLLEQNTKLLYVRVFSENYRTKVFNQYVSNQIPPSLWRVFPDQTDGYVSDDVAGPEFLFGPPEQSEAFQFAFASKSPQTTNTTEDFPFAFNFWELEVKHLTCWIIVCKTSLFLIFFSYSSWWQILGKGSQFKMVMQLKF